MKKKFLWLGVFFLLFIPNVFAKSYYVMEDGTYMLCDDIGPGVTNTCIPVNRNTPGLSINTRDQVLVYNNSEYYFSDSLQEEYDDNQKGISEMYYYMDGEKYILCKNKNSCKTYTFEQLESIGAIISNDNQIVLNSSSGPGGEETYYYNPNNAVTTIPSGPSTNNSQENNSTPTTDTCTRLKEPLKFVGKIVTIVKILIPIVIIVLGMIDFFRAIIGSKDDEIKKSAKSLVMRVIAGVVIFFLPTVVSVVFSLISDFSNIEGDFDACQKCIFQVNKCE